jgi:hypothetical protein
MPQPVVHFEIPADNPERLGRFYTDLFGWRVEKWPGPLDYWLLYTRAPGAAAIDGGMYRRELPDQRPLNYVHVASAADFAERARLLGGRVILPRTQVPGVGYVAILADPEGNAIGLYETRHAPVAAERPAPKPSEPAAPSRAEAQTRAPRRGGPVKKARPARRRSARAAKRGRKRAGAGVKKGTRKKPTRKRGRRR